MTAISLLPISKETIVYGSHDAGKTVHADYTSFNDRFDRIFKRLNLQPHLVHDKVLTGPGDIEGSSVRCISLSSILIVL